MNDAHENNALQQMDNRGSASYDFSDKGYLARKGSLFKRCVVTFPEIVIHAKRSALEQNRGECKRLRFSIEACRRVTYSSRHEIEAQGNKSFEVSTRTDAEANNPPSSSEEAIDSLEPTRMTDGPTEGVLAVQKLVCFVRHTKKVNRQQVLGMPSSAALYQSLQDQNNPLRPTSKEEISPQSLHQPLSTSIGDLRGQVLARLHALASLIEANGKAALLPCGTTVGRPYLPVIRFLASCVASAGREQTLAWRVA